MSPPERAPTDPEARLLATSVGPVAIAVEGPDGAPTVLCVHGIPGSHRDFRYLAPWLAGELRVVRLEMPGFGDSPAGAASLAGWAATVVAVADALAVDRVGMLAHSFGGGAALLAAARLGHRVFGLALVASMGSRRHRAFMLPARAFAAAAAALRVPLLGWGLARAARSIYRGNGLPVPATGDLATIELHIRLLASVRFAELAAAAASVVTPTLVVHAEDDRLVQVEIARELAGLVPGAELHVLASGGHHLNRTRPGELGPVLSRFFLRVEGQPQPAGRRREVRVPEAL